jgi:hypothetical protein
MDYYYTERDDLQAEVDNLRSVVKHAEYWLGVRTEERDALQAELNEWRTGARADETGHLRRCAKVNGAWECAEGCAKAEVERMIYSGDALARALEDVRRWEAGELDAPPDIAGPVKAWRALRGKG